MPPSRTDFATIELRAGGTRLVIVPELGGKIASMQMGGREWLWTNDVIPWRAPVEGASYVETADSGGYDECFPTVAACTVPTSVRQAGGVSLPDHGELWSQSTTCTVKTQDGLVATTEWTGRQLPYVFRRAVSLDAEGTVEMRYAVTNSGRVRYPFIWSAHPMMRLTDDTRIVLPEGSRTRVFAQHGIDLFGPGAEHRWPRFKVGREVDFSEPATVGRSYACKLFLDLTVGRAALEQEGARLDVAFDAAEVPNFGLWINRRGWTPFRRGKAYLNLGFEPCIGAPDTLSDALGSWDAAHWLGAGETRQWTLAWRAASLTA